jgi:HlyD family secretion protein
MVKLDSSASTLVIAAVMASAVAYWAPQYTSRGYTVVAGTAVAQSAAQPPAATTATKTAPAMPAKSAAAQNPRAILWSASAPGRVEPKNGDIRVGTQMSGRIDAVLVRTNDVVHKGDLLLRLDDSDVIAKLAAARAEVEVRRRERDADIPVKGAADRRTAEDATADAERALTAARLDRDRQETAAFRNGGPAPDLSPARDAVTQAEQRLERERTNLARVLAQPGLPLPTRLDSSLATARAELSSAEIALEHTRIRAPSEGTVLQVLARTGETIAPSPEAPVVVIGDLSSLRIRAEVEERDIGKIRNGQAIMVRSDAFTGQEFEGSIFRVAQSLGPPRLPARGPRRPTDLDVVEVLISLDGRPPLLPGMRVDVFFRPDATVQSESNKRVN